MFEKRQIPHSHQHRLYEIPLADNDPETDYLEMGAEPFVSLRGMINPVYEHFQASL
jgi:hypothetical protein